MIPEDHLFLYGFSLCVQAGDEAFAGGLGDLACLDGIADGDHFNAGLGQLFGQLVVGTGTVFKNGMFMCVVSCIVCALLCYPIANLVS